MKNLIVISFTLLASQSALAESSTVFTPEDLGMGRLECTTKVLPTLCGTGSVSLKIKPFGDLEVSQGDVTCWSGPMTYVGHHEFDPKKMGKIGAPHGVYDLQGCPSDGEQTEDPIATPLGSAQIVKLRNGEILAHLVFADNLYGHADRTYDLRCTYHAGFQWPEPVNCRNPSDLKQ